jgi:hypothetical protein
MGLRSLGARWMSCGDEYDTGGEARTGEPGFDDGSTDDDRGACFAEVTVNGEGFAAGGTVGGITIQGLQIQFGGTNANIVSIAADGRCVSGRHHTRDARGGKGV